MQQMLIPIKQFKTGTLHEDFAKVRDGTGTELSYSIKRL